MTSRKEILDDFRDKFIATIGTAGSKEGMPLSTAANNFTKDWSVSLDVLKRQLGHSTLQSLVDELKNVIEIRGDRVYAVVNASNTHVFGLIDRTRKKKQRSKSQLPFAAVSLPSSRRGLHFSKKSSWEQNITSRSPRFVSSGGKLNFLTAATLNKSNVLPDAFRPWQVPAAAPSNTTTPAGRFDFSTSVDRKPETPFQFPRPWQLQPRPASNSTATKEKHLSSPSFPFQPPSVVRSCPVKAPFTMSKNWIPPLMSTPLPALPKLPTTAAQPVSNSIVKSAGQQQLCEVGGPNNVEPKKRSRETNEELTSCLTPTKSPPCKTTNLFDHNFKRSGLFRSQILQIQRVTASSPLSKNSRTTELIKKPVRELVAIIFAAGRSINLEDLKKRYYEIYKTDLTGVKLTEILELEPTKKNHFIAFQSYRPPIFSCVLHNADVLVSLSKDCNPLLENMRALREIPSSDIPSTSAIATPSNVSTVSTTVTTAKTEPSMSQPPPTTRFDVKPPVVANAPPALNTPIVVKKFSQTVPPSSQPPSKTPIEPVRKQKLNGVPIGVRMSLSPPQPHDKVSNLSGAVSSKNSATDADDGNYERRLSSDFSRLSIKDESGVDCGSVKNFFNSTHMKTMLDERFLGRMSKFGCADSKWTEVKHQFAVINSVE